MSGHLVGILCTLLALAGAVAHASETDTDRDGLSDFQERYKYFTDPARADSDGDGIPDGDWHERREYTYTIRLVMAVLRPVTHSALNDDYQDARVLRTTDRHVEMEVLCYPLNRVAESIRGARDPRHAAAPLPPEALAPGVTTNWDGAMRSDMLAALAADGIDPAGMTDAETARTVSAWLVGRARPRKPNAAFCVTFMDGEAKLVPGMKAAFRRLQMDSGLTIGEILRRDVFGKGMYRAQSRGTCTSTAVYLATGLRAVGIPTRIILTIPMIDTNDPRQRDLVSRGIRRPGMLAHLRRGLSRTGTLTNHTFNEVFVGGRWRRLDGRRLGVNTDTVFGMVVHIHTFYDLSEARLGETWGRRDAAGTRCATFRTANPYRTTEVADRVGMHADEELLQRLEPPEPGEVASSVPAGATAACP